MTDRNDWEYISGDLVLTCYCHGERISTTGTELHVRLLNPEAEDPRLEVKMFLRSDEFHHADSYAIKVYGENEQCQFAFPFLEIYQINGADLTSQTGHWDAVFHSSPDGNGSHMAIKRKEGAFDGQ